MHMKWTDLLSILGPQVDLNKKNGYNNIYILIYFMLKRFQTFSIQLVIDNTRWIVDKFFYSFSIYLILHWYWCSSFFDYEIFLWCTMSLFKLYSKKRNQLINQLFTWLYDYTHRKWLINMLAFVIADVGNKQIGLNLPYSFRSLCLS